MKRLEELVLLDRRALIRADLDGTGPILERKLTAAAPTIGHVLSKGGRPIIASHLSAVEGGLSTLRPAAERLSAILGWKVRLVNGPPSTWPAALQEGERDEVVLLENLYLQPGERINDAELADELAALADIFVNDDISTAPYALASTVGVADRVNDPVAAFEVDEMKHVLADAINRMPDRERLVLTLYYYEGLTLAEIGDVLGVTESRVCQIHTKAIFQLRGRLSEPMPERGLIT
jgi:RNA polymerase sigma factor (sigma-70 family)